MASGTVKRLLFGGALALALALAGTSGGVVGHAANPSPDVDSVTPNFQNAGASQAPVAIAGFGFMSFGGSPVSVTDVQFGTSHITTQCSGPPPAGGCFTVNGDTSITAFPPASPPHGQVHINVTTTGSPTGGTCGSASCTSLSTSENLFVFTNYHTLQLLDVFGGVHAVSSNFASGTSNFGFNIARGVALLPDPSGGSPSGYELDGLGGIHAFGGAQAMTDTAYWPHWDIARDIVLQSTGNGGYVLDGLGGIHPFGTATGVSGGPYWPNFDIAKKIVLRTDTSGYVLDGLGGIHSFGGAPAMTDSAYWANWDIARDIVLQPGGNGGYVLDGLGGIHQFGTANGVTGNPYWANWDIARGLVLDGTPSGGVSGGYVLDGLGGVHAFGSGATSTPVVQTSYYNPSQITAYAMRGV